MNFATPSLPTDLYPNPDAANGLSSSVFARSGAFGDLAGGALKARASWLEAKNYADAYQSAADKARRKQSQRSAIGGALQVLGGAASFIPGAGPLISAGLRGIGGMFG